MNYALSRPTAARRSGLLGIVVAAHLGALLLIVAAKTVAPRTLEIPLVVDLLQPAAEPKPPEARPLPVARPQPAVRQKSAPKPAAPLIEATTSTVPADAAPAASPADTRPAPPAKPVLTQPRFDADYLKNPAPPYPAIARRMGEQGTVILRIAVTAQGTAEGVEVRTSSGSPRLDEAAVSTVRHWKFVPARRGDTPVASWVLVPINFKLEQ
jgi:protein TonB